MKSSFHLLVGSSSIHGGAKIYSQNVLLPFCEGLPPRFEAIVYAAHDLRAGSPAAALVIRAVLYRPMMPVIAPGNPLWDDIVVPHFRALVAVVRQQAGHSGGPRLGGVAARVAAMLKNQPGVLSGDGALLVPQDHPPLVLSARVMPPPQDLAPPFPVARRSSLSLAA